MKIVVTGGAGFIGSAFISYMKSNYKCDILCIDVMNYAASITNIKHDVRFLQKDICNVTPEDLGDYDYLVNFAAESHVDNSIKNGKPFIKSNVEGVFNLLECARRNTHLKKFVQISTDEVYGDMQDYYDNYRFINHSATEESPLKPSSYYSATKAAADLLVMSANRTFGVPYLITRTCNNFGDHQFSEKYIPLIHKCIKEGVPVPVYGDGSQTREWIHVDDNVRIVADLMLDDKTTNQIFNISSNIEYKNIEIINMISEYLQKPVDYVHVPDRPGHDRAYRMRSVALSNLYNVLGIGKKIPYTFQNLKDYLKRLCNTI